MRRVRGRIEMILNAAKAEKLRSGDNPAQWRGHLDQVLTRRKKSEVKHHPALPYRELPAFMTSLRTDQSEAARLLEFIILTAVRFDVAPPQEGEVSGDLWKIPARRMKAGPGFRGAAVGVGRGTSAAQQVQRYGSREVHSATHRAARYDARVSLHVPRLVRRLH